MTFQLRPAVRENVPLLIGLAGGTGSGKTYSALRLAYGLSGGQKFAVIDTESGRARTYADDFSFEHGDLSPPFRPERYAEAVRDVDAMGKFPVIVIDSASHEYAGEGGVLDWHEEELQRMAGDDYQKRESCKMAAWIKPKISHKAFVNKLLQVRAHIILCYRAEPKTEIAKERGKTVVRPKQGMTGLDGWFPICENRMPYELTAYFLLMSENPGVPRPIKLMERHKPFFPLDKPITEEAGRQLAEWAKGGKPKEQTTVPKQSKNKPAVEAVRKKIQAAQSTEDLQALIESEISELADGEKAELREEFKNRMAEVMA